ncbi:MAG: TonB-dependent receptor plug domain-containing protein, partial [Gammaproteobacteria bacterium]
MADVFVNSTSRRTGALLVAGVLVQIADPAHGALPTVEPAATEEVVVTARKREERLQDVPNVVTTFDAAMIESAGIAKTSDYMALTPNLTYRDGSDFQSGFYFISMRGVGNGQDGWPSVTILVDGVRQTSLAAIDSGQLVDIKRIEVVHGPQGALYGAGAIAGAVNIITKAPTNDFEGRLKAGYARGDDRSVATMLSGPIIADKLLYRVNGTYRESDGLIKSASNGIDLDFQRLGQFDGRLIYNATDTLNFDLRAQLIDEKNGAVYQPKYAVGADLDPAAAAASRAFPGTDDRDLYNASLKAEWDLGPATLISVSGWGRVRNQNLSSACWDDPNDPGVVVSNVPGFAVGCLFNPFLGAFGDAAPPGAPIDQYFAGKGDYKSLTSDLRLVSNTKGRLQWMLGA